MTLQNGELFAAQEREGDQIRRELRQPEPEFVRTCIRYVTIYKWVPCPACFNEDERWPGPVMYETYDEAANNGNPELGIAVAAVRAVSIDL